MRKLLVLILFLTSMLAVPTQAQDASQTFTWRAAGLLMDYPASWLAGEYAGNAILVSTQEGLELALTGETPGTSALGFYTYPQAGNLAPQALLQTLFPDTEVTLSSLGGVASFETHFEDAETDQTLRAIAFVSPVSRDSHVLVGVAPTGDWSAFEPVLDSILTTAQFINATATFEFLGTTVSFSYPRDWETATTAQLLAVAPERPEAVLEGAFESAETFLRAQILAVAGIGLDPESEDVPQQVLSQFAGETLEDVVRFDWGEWPAAATIYQFDNLQLLMAVVLVEDNAVLFVGGSTSEQWPTSRAYAYGALNTMLIDEVAPPVDLDMLLRGEPIEGDIFGMVIE